MTLMNEAAERRAVNPVEPIGVTDRRAPVSVSHELIIEIWSTLLVLRAPRSGQSLTASTLSKLPAIENATMIGEYLGSPLRYDRAREANAEEAKLRASRSPLKGMPQRNL